MKHSLLECNMARCVWALQCDELVDFISQAQDDNARGWIHEAIAGLAHDKLVRLCCNFVGNLACEEEGNS